LLEGNKVVLKKGIFRNPLVPFSSKSDVIINWCTIAFLQTPL
jgi:hypothetical protein